ncbi:Integral membrane protein OS=Streptomyces violarus OX=67380 GN=FHS41_007740 PE=4 SV=1 [Streptomyces violarus]
MTNQPYDGYDPYGQQPQAPQTPQGWPGQGHQQGYPQGQQGQQGHQGYEDPYAAQQYTQQWQGQTWETQSQAPVSAQVTAAEETAYLPPQGYEPPAPAPAPTPASAAEYGPATVAGNARITDAQRARAEGRSPIIEPGMQPAALTALLGLLRAGAAAVGTYALLVPLVVLQAVTAAGWFRLNGMWPARQGIALGFAGALAADAALLASDRSPSAILGTLGVWVLLALVLQLRSHADPDERMYGLMATVAASALAIVAGGYLAAEADAVTVGAIAVAVAVLARALPLPTPASVVVALLAAAGGGAAAGSMTAGTSGALLGAGAAACALIGHRVASYDYPSRFSSTSRRAWPCRCPRGPGGLCAGAGAGLAHPAAGNRAAGAARVGAAAPCSAGLRNAPASAPVPRCLACHR